MSKNQCRLDYCPYAELIGEYASCTACSWASYEDEKDAEDMTKEEAIKVLNTYDVNFDEYTAEEIADAIDMAIEALSTPSGDLISRADAIEELQNCIGLIQQDGQDYLDERDIPLLNTAIDALKALPSADAESDDLIIKGAKGIQDGLYNIKDGKLFKYKAKGGTVRTYPIVPSADAVHGEWKFVDHEIFAGEYFCNICGKRANVDLYGEWILSNYCPSCGAIMKGGVK